jgi:hypothetical protein
LTVTTWPAIVAVPLLAPSVLDWMSSLTVPSPEPPPLTCIEIHAALLTAVHGHSFAVLTLTFSEPPDDGTAIVSGETTALHPDSCVTVNVWPSTTIVPVRAVEAFADTANSTLPGPFPLAPDVMLIHGALAAAVHAQDNGVLTAKDPEPPAAETVCPFDESVNVQPPDCTTVNV